MIGNQAAIYRLGYLHETRKTSDIVGNLGDQGRQIQPDDGEDVFPGTTLREDNRHM